MGILIKSDNEIQENNLFKRGDLPFFDTRNIKLWVRATSLGLSGLLINNLINKYDQSVIKNSRTSEFDNPWEDDIPHADLQTINGVDVINAQIDGGSATGTDGSGYFIDPSDDFVTYLDSGVSAMSGYVLASYRTFENSQPIASLNFGSANFEIGIVQNELVVGARLGGGDPFTRIEWDNPEADTFFLIKFVVDWSNGVITGSLDGEESSNTELSAGTFTPQDNALFSFFKRLSLESGEIKDEGGVGFTGNLASFIFVDGIPTNEQDEEITERLQSLRDTLNEL